MQLAISAIPRIIAASVRITNQRTGHPDYFGHSFDH
jgi:hypothetical protein